MMPAADWVKSMSGSGGLRGAVAYILPAVAAMLVIAGPPLLYIFYTSLGGQAFSLHFFQLIVASELFRRTLGTTVMIALSASLLSLVLGFVIALHLARQPARRRAVLMVLVLLPFWTSALVKCYAFTVILGRDGIINSLLSWGLDARVHLPLMLNRVGVLVGMTNYLTPFVVFPVLASLLAIDGAVYRAAAIMGAKPARIFWTVTVPMSFPGVFAALASIFVMSLGFFIIPALLGGPHDAMLANLIDFYTRETLDWNRASAIGVILLGMVLIVATPTALLRRRNIV